MRRLRGCRDNKPGGLTLSSLDLEKGYAMGLTFGQSGARSPSSSYPYLALSMFRGRSPCDQTLRFRMFETYSKE